MITLTLLSMVIMACSGDNTAAEESGRSDAVYVKTVRLEPTSFYEYLEITGTVKARNQIKIIGEEGGLLKTVRKDKGSYARSGDTLAVLENRVLEASYKEAKAGLQQAELNHNSSKVLFSKKAISENEFLASQYTMDRARAAYDFTRARYDKLFIVAPISGRVNDRYYDFGAYIMPMTPVFELIDNGKVKVEAGVAERFISDIGMNFFPPSLRFVAFLMSQFKYIGGIYLILGTNSLKWLYVSLIIFLSLVSSIINGMFHNFILWSTLLFTIISMILHFKTYQKVLIISFGFLFLITLQIIKAQYRDMIELGVSDADRVEIFIDLFSEELLSGLSIDNEENLKSVITRLNQGWIVSAIMQNVPRNEDFANGKTVIEAVQSSLVPRFLDKDKKTAGGRENFIKYTGLPLTQQTSMGISVIGEAYINFGVYGGILFMFIYGLGIALLFKLFIQLSITRPSLILWSPLLFLQAVKAETELVVILNHVIKSGILVLLFIYVTQKFLGWKY